MQLSSEQTSPYRYPLFGICIALDKLKKKKEKVKRTPADITN